MDRRGPICVYCCGGNVGTHTDVGISSSSEYLLTLLRLVVLHLLRGLPIWHRVRDPIPSVTLRHGPYMDLDEDDDPMDPELWGILHNLRSAPAASEANRQYHTVGEFPGSESPISVPEQAALGLSHSGIGNMVKSRPFPSLPVIPASPERRTLEEFELRSLRRRPSTLAGA